MASFPVALPSAPAQPTPLAQPILRVNGHEASGQDVFDAAWIRRDLASTWSRFRAAQTARDTARDRGLTADAAHVDDLINEVRYRFDLVAAEDVAPWLSRNGLTQADLEQHGERAYWGQPERVARLAPTVPSLDPTAEERHAFAAELMLTGQFSTLARHWAMRRLATTGTVNHIADAAHWPGPTTAELAWLGRDTAWFSEQAREDRHYTAVCTGLCTEAARTHWLRTRGTSLTRIGLAWLDFDSAEAMREAQLCLTTDGQTLEEVAGAARLLVETRSALLDELEPELSAVVANRRADDVIPWHDARAGRFRLLQLKVKQPPHLGDSAVRAKVDAGIVAAHFGPRLAAEVQWLLEAARPDHGG